jgi:hypothetical protein
MMMNRITKLLTLSACVVCAVLFVSCGKKGGEVVDADYIEVTVDGKTIKEKTRPASYGRHDVMYYQYNGNNVTVEMSYIRNLEELAAMPTGAYRLLGTFTADSKIFDLVLGVHEKYQENWRGVENGSGNNKVTSIKKSGDSVVVKGEFSGKLVDGADVSGTYSLTLYSY